MTFGSNSYWREFFRWAREDSYDPYSDLRHFKQGRSIQIDTKARRRLVKKGLVIAPVRALMREGRTEPGYYQLAPKSNSISRKMTAKGVRRMLRQLDKKVKRMKTYKGDPNA